ncbi:MAG TPA: hypothetical protein VF627_13475, partial [Abditibacterium sp.]
MSFALAVVVTAYSLAPLGAQPKVPRLIGSAFPGSGGDVFLAGGYSKQKGWFFDDTARHLAVPGTKWQLVGLSKRGPQIVTGKVEAGDGVGGFLGVGRTKIPKISEISSAATEQMLALSNVSNAQPRLARVQGLKAPIYASEAKKLLARAGLKVITANLTQLVRVDLDGDGRDEAIFCARSRPDFG